MPEPLLSIRNASKHYQVGGGIGQKKREVVALQDFNLDIEHKPATITTIAGESGSGKTTLANVVLGFTSISSGQILYQGKDTAMMTAPEILEYRRNVQAVFQDPFGVYNPFYRIEHLFDLVNKNFKLTTNASDARERIEDALNVVGLLGEEILRKYPHQLSGGQRQRIMMARAYLIKPKVIVADEPVSMVDASLRAAILDVMLKMRDKENISFLYITHDLSTAYQVGDKIFILYQGSIAEKGQTTAVIDKPHHPYVKLLVDSVPQPDPDEKWGEDIELPDEETMRNADVNGCRFYPRCPQRMDKCLSAQPPLYSVGEREHEAACYLYDGTVHKQPVMAKKSKSKNKKK
jgi:peptide/nickel transport system ATP-binding protein